jgi:cation diffusion facilitator CzcD-associated flavoprotein CzcO
MDASPETLPDTQAAADDSVSAERFDIAIVGAGFSGLGMAMELKRAGREDFCLIDKATNVGGTWRDNTYPGCACDIPSHLYSFTREMKPDWSRMYPRQAEIWAYQRALVERHGLESHLRLGWQVEDMTWNEADRRWTLMSADGRTITARNVVCGLGGLHIPQWPNIAGMDRFARASFHTARWDHSVNLAGKRVGIIGTGASAIQIVPEIAPETGHLHLFQRTPPWILPKGDRAMLGIERAAFRAIPPVQRFYRWLIYWLNEVRAIAFVKQPERMDRAANQALKHLEQQVSDPELRAKLTPDYRIGCKRVLISNDYYPALQRENVTLETTGIASVTPGGVTLRDGREVALDVLVYATGFKPFDMVEGLSITGRGGRDLGAEWGTAPNAHRGITVSGYPNLFFLMGPNTGLGHNSMIYMIESGVAYVMDALDKMDGAHAVAIDVKPEAQAAFVSDVRERLKGTVWASGCSSWYRGEDGEIPTLWPDFTFKYRKLTRELDAENYEFLART